MRIAIALAAILVAGPALADKHHGHYEGKIHVKAPYVDVKIDKNVGKVDVKVGKVAKVKIHKATYKKHYKRKYRYHRPRYHHHHGGHYYRPTWIPAWCGRCGVVKKIKHLSTQVKVKTTNGLTMLFAYGQRPPPSMDGRNWACTDFSQQQMPFFHIWKGTCAFKAYHHRPVSIQPVEPYEGYKDAPIIRKY